MESNRIAFQFLAAKDGVVAVATARKGKEVRIVIAPNSTTTTTTTSTTAERDRNCSDKRARKILWPAHQPPYKLEF